MPRTCGGCTLCCKLMPVRELAKPANTRCEHQSSRGCGIYRKLGFPRSCELWSCAWLTEADTADQPRPDRAGYVIDIIPDMIRARRNETHEIEFELVMIQVWVGPGFDRHHLPPALKRFAERRAAEGQGLLLRNGSAGATAVFAPGLMADNRWRFVDSNIMDWQATKTGNLLLDRLKEERDAVLGGRAGAADDKPTAL